MARTLYITEPVFKTETLVIWDCSSEELGSFLEKKHNVVDFDYKHYSDADGAVVQLDGYPHRVVWMEKLQMNPCRLGVLTHEMVHHAVRICRDKGIPFDGDQNNDETLAYLVDFYVRSTIESLRKKRKCKNKK